MPVSIPPSKDIPPARREPTEVSLAEIENLHLAPAPRRSGSKLALCLLLVVSISAAGYWQRGWLATVPKAIAQRDFTTSPPRTQGGGAVAAETSDSAGSERSSSKTPPATSSDPEPSSTTEDEADELLNHRRYQVAEADVLVPLNAGSGILLRPDAKAAIADMIEAAQADGVQLGIISGFRTLEDQNYLYFDLKAERGESAQARAEVSAPPGYSEHHTGYAVDFIDESKPDTFLEESFETTAAFEWLEANAAFFNFEMSFPRDNAAELSYEPWHWRYVGNRESLELFYK